MSSPYPPSAETCEDKQIYAMDQASIWLSRISDDNTDVDLSDVVSNLNEDRKEFKEAYLERHLHDIALDDFLWNHVDLIKELFRTDSLDRRIAILKKARNTVMGRFGSHKPDSPSYDEMEEMIRTAVIEAKNEGGSPGEYYEDLEFEDQEVSS